MPPPSERFLVFTAVRDEGPWLVEWLCWYRMLGFEALVAHNDCTDRSPELLARLSEAGWCEAVGHQVPPDLARTPQRAALRLARGHPSVARADWLLVCDVDEFLVLGRGDGTIGGYLDSIGRRHRGVAFFWRCFGSGGRATYEDGLVHRRFTRWGPQDPDRVHVKTMMREPARFREFHAHAPVGFDGFFGWGRNRFVDAAGAPMRNFGRLSRRVLYGRPAEAAWAAARMNHYVVRSEEDFAGKRGTPSASDGWDRYNDWYKARYDRNDHEDLSALAFAPAFDRLHAEAMALPGVRRLHHLCCADYVEALCLKAGRRPEDDPRWHHHHREAGEEPRRRRQALAPRPAFAPKPPPPPRRPGTLWARLRRALGARLRG